MNGYEDTECEKYFTPPDDKPSTANREAVLGILKPLEIFKVDIDKYADQILSLIEPKGLDEIRCIHCDKTYIPSGIRSCCSHCGNWNISDQATINKGVK